MPHDSTAPTQDRDLRLQGCWNVRDLGGMASENGGRVRRGQVFRAAALDLATDDDLRVLGTLGLKRVFDLRADRERDTTTPLWCAGLGIQPWTRDYAGKAGDLRARLADSRGADRDMHGAMIAAYRRLPHEQAPAIAAIFAALAAGESPLLFHCAVGKDRTGMITALLLATLGVPRDDILTDYLLTNRHADAIRASLMRHPFLAAIDVDEDKIRGPLAIADADYLATLFDTIDAADSIDAFLGTVAGITPDVIMRIRDYLLE